MATRRLTGYASGSTYGLYDLFRDEDGNVLNNTTLTLEVWGASSHTRVDYSFSLTDLSGDLYGGDFDANFPIGTILYRSTYEKAAATESDSDTLIYGPERIEWTGESVLVDGEEASITALCNLAFIKLGGAAKTIRLSSYFEETANALLCQQLWPQVRKEVLIRGGKAGVNWEEASVYAELGEDLADTTTIEMADWTYIFALPSDCLRVIMQTAEDARTAEYECEVLQGHLLTDTLSNTDEDTAFIKYIYDNDDITTYSPTLYAAMICKMAAEMAPVIVNSDRRNQLLEEFETLVLSLAGGKNQSQVYYNDKGKTNVKDARHRPYGRDE
jgi:hypothetical protein